MRYAYYGGFAAAAAAAGAVVLLLYGYALPGVLAAITAGALFWLVGVHLLLVPEVAHWRRVRRAVRDWNGVTAQIGAVGERRWQSLVPKLAALRPPPALAERHADALDLLRARPGRDAAPAASGAFAVRARVTMRALLEAAGPSRYATALRRLWTNAEAAGDRDNAQLEVRFDAALQRMRRMKPPPSMADTHARLIELTERYSAALKQRNAAMRSADGPGVQAASQRLETMGGEYRQLLRPWAEHERLRWYGPD